MRKYSRPVEGERGGGGVASTAQDCRGAQGACAGDLHDDTDDNDDDDDDDEYIYVMVVMLMMMILQVKGLVESEEERQGGGSAKATPVKIQHLIPRPDVFLLSKFLYWPSAKAKGPKFLSSKKQNHLIKIFSLFHH